MLIKRLSFEGNINQNLLPDGVKIEKGESGKELVFSGFDDDQIKDICKRMSGLVGNATRTKYKATDADRLAVAAMIDNESVDVGTFGIYRAVVSSTQVDSGRDKFSVAVLNEMALQYSDGRTVVLGHDMYSAVGKTFDAEVVADGENHLLYVKFYVLPGLTTTTGGEVKLMLDTGAYDRFSIGAFMKISDVVRDEETGQRTYFYDHTNMIVAHLGIVDMGANTDAMSKSASGTGISFGRIKNENQKNNQMKFEKTYKRIGNVSVNLEQEAIEAFLDSIEKQFEGLSKKLETFEQKESEKLKSLRDLWSASKKQLDPKAEAEKLEKRAALLTADILEEDIVEMKKEIAKRKQLEINPEGETKGKGTKLQIII